jgi:uncharacterized protein YjbI with pentapeptide repeats
MAEIDFRAASEQADHLEDADITGLDLTGWNFDNCNLRRSDLSCYVTGQVLMADGGATGT